jgi:hypothetical protein
MCLSDHRALRHHDRHDAGGFELGATPDHSDLELTNEVGL